MPGGNLSADSVASTDPRGVRYCIPLSLFARKSLSGEAPKRQILGVWGQSPRNLRRPPKLASEVTGALS
jgi:hypothetical protein